MATTVEVYKEHKVALFFPPNKYLIFYRYSGTTPEVK